MWATIVRGVFIGLRGALGLSALLFGYGLLTANQMLLARLPKGVSDPPFGAVWWAIVALAFGAACVFQLLPPPRGGQRRGPQSSADVDGAARAAPPVWTSAKRDNPGQYDLRPQDSGKLVSGRYEASPLKAADPVLPWVDFSPCPEPTTALSPHPDPTLIEPTPPIAPAPGMTASEAPFAPPVFRSRPLGRQRRYRRLVLEP